MFRGIYDRCWIVLADPGNRFCCSIAAQLSCTNGTWTFQNFPWVRKSACNFREFPRWPWSLFQMSRSFELLHMLPVAVAVAIGRCRVCLCLGHHELNILQATDRGEHPAKTHMTTDLGHRAHDCCWLDSIFAYPTRLNFQKYPSSGYNISIYVQDVNLSFLKFEYVVGLRE